MTKKSVKPSVQKPATTTHAQSETHKIGKKELVSMVADQTGLTKKQSDEAVSGILDSVIDALKSGKSVGLVGIGTLSVKATAARSGVRPGTSEKIQIPAGKKVAFKIAQNLKAEL